MHGNAQRWIFAAVIYFCIGVVMGVYMGATHDHSLFPVHAHVNLLGWVSLVLIGVIYHFFPQAGSSQLATVQFYLHNAALLVMMVALAFYLKGNRGIEPVIAVGSLGMLTAVIMFAGNVLVRRA